MKLKVFFATVVILLAASTAAFAFGKGGCGEGKCSDCHSLSKEQAKDVLTPLGVQFEVESVQLSQVPGLWDVVVKRPDGYKIPIFVDFSLKYMIQGEALVLANKENITKSRMIDLNRVDFSSIPLDDALVMGNPKAKIKIVVFDDPECPFCQKLQESMKEVVKKRSDIAFLIKMLPLEIHPTAYDKAKTIVCEKSLDLLDKSLNKIEFPLTKCDTDQIEKNKVLAAKLRVGSTPTLVMPDGRVMPGFKTADEIIKAVSEDGASKAKN